VAAALAVMGLAGWEAHVRSLGYGPSYDDTPSLWVPQRKRAVGAKLDQVVFVGASRNLFDMNLDVFQKEIGGLAPIQLSTVGSNPLVILEDLALDSSFAGTVIMGVVPGLLASAAGPPISNPTKYVKRFRRWSPADSMELPLVLFFDGRIAFVNKEELRLAALLSAWDLPNRDKVYAPTLPGYLYTVDERRQARMLDAVANDPEARHVVQQTWVPLFRGPPKPSVFSDEQWRKLLSEGWESNLIRLKTAVSAIALRGGRVIFSRLPSTEGVRETERKTVPRPLFWERILHETGAPGIHFEDYPELSGFECPEWSHLNGEDAAEYTRRFARILKAQGLF
jgi:hypothetical protein